MFIAGLQKSSLLDYPDKISAIVFTQGCNFRCGYCHNPDLIKLENANSVHTENDVIAFLKTRIGKLDGVVITGGEPTLQKDLKIFIQKIKDLGFCVKLDTNGSNPDVLCDLIQSNLLDYIAMDIKAPFEKYNKIIKSFANIEKIQQSVNNIMTSNVEYEFRTTVIRTQLTFDDFEEIGKSIKGAKKYYLQKFVASKIFDEKLLNEKTYSTVEFEQIKSILQKYVRFVEVR